MCSLFVTSHPTMWTTLLLIVLYLLGSSGQQLFLVPVSPVSVGVAGAVRPPWCGACPPVSCLNLPAVPLGYCCGCRLASDNAPITCPINILCPPASPRLCGDYNYLMDCCCGYT